MLLDAVQQSNLRNSHQPQWQCKDGSAGTFVLCHLSDLSKIQAGIATDAMNGARACACACTMSACPAHKPYLCHNSTCLNQMHAPAGESPWHAELEKAVTAEQLYQGAAMVGDGPNCT